MVVNRSFLPICKEIWLDSYLFFAKKLSVLESKLRHSAGVATGRLVVQR
jgi:hypothetical protein